MIITRSRIGIPKQRNCSPKKRFNVLYVSSEDTKNPEDSCKSPGFSEKVKNIFYLFCFVQVDTFVAQCHGHQTYVV